MIEALHAGGRVSAADWRKYLDQDEPATLEVRANVVRGDPIPYHFYGQIRGDAGDTFSKAPIPSIFGSVPGCISVNPNSEWSGSRGAQFGFTGTISLTDDSWKTLQPGVHRLDIIATGVLAGAASNPALFHPVRLHGVWKLLNDGQQSVHLYHDEVMAARVQPMLTHRFEIDRGPGGEDIEVYIGADRPPVDLALDVVLRSGGKEWKPAAGGSWIIIEKNEWSAERRAYFHNVGDLVGRRVDVIPRPSVRLAAYRMHIDRLLDHEFVLKNVLVDDKK